MHVRYNHKRGNDRQQKGVILCFMIHPHLVHDLVLKTGVNR